MKRFLLFLFSAGLLVAQSPAPYTATLSAAGTTPGWLSQAQNHTLQVVVGSPATCTVRLEGSQDNVNWFDLSGTQSCTSSTMFHVDGKPVIYARANLLTYSGGGTAQISYWGR